MPSPRYWREIPARYRMEAAKCLQCGKVLYPARRLCPACRSKEFETINLSLQGAKVITATVVHIPADTFQMEAPFAVAVVESREGARFMAQVVDCEPSSVKPGMEVDLEFRLLSREDHGGILCYGHKAVPAGTP